MRPSWADGLITVDQPRDALRRVIDAYRDAGGRGPIAVQVHLSWAPTDEEALAIAHDQWRTGVLPGPLAWELDTPEAFDEAHRGRHAPTQVAETVQVSADPARHLADGSPSSPSSASTASTCTTSASSRTRFIDTFGEHVLPDAQGGGAMKITDRSDLWWKTAVVYCLDVETYMDWNDDGIGDFEGLAHRLDYLAELGVTCLWLMPF